MVPWNTFSLNITSVLFLIHVYFRCVDEKDKAVAMGFGGTLMSMFAFIPAPIMFGFIIGKFKCTLPYWLWQVIC